jgi:hypothetical protein
MPRQKKQGKERLTRVSAKFIPREEIDWDRYAWAVLQYVRSLSEDEESDTP